MKKQIMLIAGFFLGSAGFAMAEGAVVYWGVGYHASFLGTPIEVDIDEYDILSDIHDEKDIVVFKRMPLGASSYLGGGYGFGSREIFIVGGEAVMGWAMSLNPLGAFHFHLQGRALAKYSPSEHFSVIGFVGVKGIVTLSKWVIPSGAYPVFGVRVEPLFFYLEYAAAPRGNFSKVYSHDISIGAIISFDVN